MKLLFFIYSLSAGGAERVTATLANYWAEKGWEITIVTITGKEKDFYSLHPAIRRIALKLDSKSENVFAGARHNFYRVYALRQVLKREKPDIAIGMMTTANCLLALASAGLSIPTIGAERTHPPHLPLGKIWSWMRRKLYSRLSVVTALTQETAVWLKKHTNAKRIVVIPNAVSYPLPVQEPIIKPETILGSTKQNKILLAIGRLAPEKGFDRLLEVFAKLSPQFPDWRLIILGEGQCRRELERQIEALSLKNRVFLPGTVGNIGDWYKIADLYVMTSRREGFPNALVEALAYGLPAVSVDCDTGPRDIIRHGIDGLLVPQNNMDALVKALSTLMGNEELRRRYATRAVEARERFSIKRICGMWEKLFKKVKNGL